MGEEDGKWNGEWVYENEERRVEEWERLLWLSSCGMDPLIDFNTDSMVVYEIGAECTYGIME